MKNFILIIVAFLNTIFSFGQISDKIMNNFIRIDSLELYRKDKNTELLTMIIKEDIKKSLKLIDWQKASERGLINKVKEDSLKYHTNSKYFFDFKGNNYVKNKIMYFGNQNKTLIVFARFYKNDSILDKNIDSLFTSHKFDSKLIKANYKSYDNVQRLLKNFAFKPFLLSEKIRMEFSRKLYKEKFIEGNKLKSILDTYQISSGNKTSVGQLLAIKDFLLSGKTLIIKKWLWNKDIEINNVSQLQGFIQSYDPVIDILNGNEFKK